MISPVAVSATEKVVLSKNLSVPDSLTRALRRADDFIKLAIVSARSAIDLAPSRQLLPEQIGIFMGTAYGPIETNFRFLDTLIDDGERQASPTLFSHSVHNAAAGYVARLLDIQGPALTMTSFSWPFLTAISEARLAVDSGRVRRALVLGIETNSPLLEDARRQLQGNKAVSWQPGAVAWILDTADQVSSYAVLLEDIVLTEIPCNPDIFLTRTGETWNINGLIPQGSRHPMAYAYALTDAVSRLRYSNQDIIKWTITAPFGQAQLTLRNKDFDKQGKVKEIIGQY